VTKGRPVAAAPRILVVGDLMIDTIVKPEGPLARGSDRRAAIVDRPGGSAANQAAWLAHFGAAVDFVARVGAADRRREAARLRRAGVTPHLVGDARHETGRLIALVEASGERSFLTDRGANLALSARDLSDALVDGAAMIHLSGYSFFTPGPREAVVSLIARAAGRPVGVDPASAEFLREAGPESFLAWTRGATTLFPNAEEAAVLAGTDDPETQGARLAAHYPLVVVKRGSAGCEAFAGNQRWQAAAPRVEVKDSTGAGDAFVAAFLVARLAGRTIERCLAEAAAAGAAATEFIGGQPETRRACD
jgi:sugar/nucleoside kinase (ribokinase family)